MGTAFLLCCKLPHKGKFQPVTHTIFDLDGTLIDTQWHYITALRKTCDFYGKKYDESLSMKILGRPSEKVVEITLEALKLKVPKEEFMKKYREFSYELVVDCEMLPGVETVVKHLYDHKIPMAIATSSVQDGFNKKMLKHQEFLKMFDHVVVSSDPEVKHGKPYPDIFLVCSKRFPDNPAAEKCLVFEDSPNGVIAALAAGMQCVMIPDKAVPKELCADATLLLKRMDEFCPELFGLPPIDNKK